MPRQSKVSQHYGFEKRSEYFDRFQFHNDFAVDKQIQAVAGLELNVLTNYQYGLLPLERDAAKAEFVTKAFFVGGF